MNNNNNNNNNNNSNLKYRIIGYFLVSLFSILSKFIFELGFIFLVWYNWKWRAGLVAFLWYVLWSWISTELIMSNIHYYNKKIRNNQNNRHDSDNNNKN